MGFIRNVYKRLLLVPGVPFLFQFARRNCAPVFMLHRFSDRERGIQGLDPSQLRRSLDYLRRNNYEFLSLADLFSRLAGNGPELSGAVVFTIDDGYIDHAEVAAPIFAEFDCPVTTFVTTGFLDGNLWMWWDKIEYIFSKTNRSSLHVLVGEGIVKYDLLKGMKRDTLVMDFVKRCKIVEESERLKVINHLAMSADVELPVKPPDMYAPMSWDDARACEKNGMTFGPHTVTHPILSRIPTEQSVWEITESWQRICAEVRSPIPVFCYPNGQSSDFGPREIDVFQKIGLLGAVVGTPGSADLASFRQDNEGPFRVCRFTFPETLSDLIQYASGIERFKQIVRRRI